MKMAIELLLLNYHEMILIKEREDSIVLFLSADKKKQQNTTFKISKMMYC